MTAPLTSESAAAFERCVADGGVAVFPADTVYGLACDPERAGAVERLYALKGRPPRRPAAVMFFALAPLLEALGSVGAGTEAALERLLPGPVTAVVPNRERRFPLACADEPGRLGVRVPALPGALAPLAAVGRPVLQSSANRSGAADARRLEDVDPTILGRADLALDAGELPGTPSTVVDLTRWESERMFSLVREGALGRAEVEVALQGC